MHTVLSGLISRLSTGALLETDVIPWSCPIPSFGDLSASRIATVGLNPSNREFVDASGAELDGSFRRFHTLRSLGLARWSDIRPKHLRLIRDSCRDYFRRRPYDAWFKRLDHLLSGTTASFYAAPFGACHLDLIPYATARKWTGLTGTERSLLLTTAADTLALLLRNSPVRTLILNGASVVTLFQRMAGVRLESRAMSKWSLSRRVTANVTGVAYQGSIRYLSGIRLPHDILVLGYNHNIQSSFGVTTEVAAAIRDWIARSATRTTS